MGYAEAEQNPDFPQIESGIIERWLEDRTFEASVARRSTRTGDQSNELVEAGLLERRRYSDHPPRDEYVPTARGRDFRPVLVSLLAWGNKHFAPEGPSIATPARPSPPSWSTLSPGGRSTNRATRSRPGRPQAPRLGRDMGPLMARHHRREST
jgi:hypothetical protein